MGMPAARALIDKAAHSGPIQSGSPDVIIGGFPAARKSDRIVCSEHGNGIIVGGTVSVYVNGLPLARKGDKTQCSVSGSTKEDKPQPKPPQYWGGSLAKKASEDGTIHGDHFDATILSAISSLQDKNADGSFDTASSGFALEDLTMGNMKSNDLARGELRNKIAVANVTGTWYGYSGDSDITGFNNSATALGMQYGASGALGKEGTLYGGGAGDVTLGTAEAKAVTEIYKGNNGRYGFSAEAGAEAAAVKGEASGNFDLYGIIVTNAKISGTAAAVGLSGGITGYIDTNDDSLNIKLSGEVMMALGLGFDIDTKISIKRILEWGYQDDDSENKKSIKASSGEGFIITGCSSVLVGD